MATCTGMLIDLLIGFDMVTSCINGYLIV